jgi:hypothetical protein
MRGSIDLAGLSAGVDHGGGHLPVAGCNGVVERQGVEGAVEYE